ncbi:3-deoxy-7-phosphoheptulonate synthase [Streptomyces sp. SCSIO ZS0520]|uniref:3-deoxy-7-phosphoheptulonate synthase n=1 Tax=Streptomyces sp. SCSIO ZS0520 TaxID=2892996 RepID=UPI0021D9F140|nr:3-deoxy-7-phosphoheptulonate synthase [Streptomyces sp. SCSIO ZS0520]
MEEAVREIRVSEALQQPRWGDPRQVRRVREALAARPPLVRAEDIARLRTRLAAVARGEALVVQAGDCAEDPRECTRVDAARKRAVLDLLAGALRATAHRPVIRVGRIAGQFAKPRSRPTERVGDCELPSYRGHMVNAPEPDADSRRPDPLRILTGYMAAAELLGHLGWRPGAGTAPPEAAVWTSHEALLMDYEVPLVRTAEDGTPFLGSTHWPWIGERTRQVTGAHVALLAEVGNPVACKVGPGTTPAELLALCARLDPEREAGRLTLIARMGAEKVAELLPRLVAAVRAAGHPVIWLSDPMHGNTLTAPGGHKTRRVRTLAQEVSRFCAAVRGEGGVPGGLHLETTPDEVTECVSGDAALDHVGDRYTSLCDPRLTPWQALSVVQAWGT